VAGEDWTAVSREVNRRATTLGMRQKDLADRSGVSLAIIREIQQNKTHRRRNPRTLEALSVALQWHPQHLGAVLAGIKPPDAAPDATPPADPVAAALESVVRELRGLRAQVGTLTRRIEAAVPLDGSKNQKSRQP
jgi:transcriptional regulator with XRE-family HTH domain